MAQPMTPRRTPISGVQATQEASAVEGFRWGDRFVLTIETPRFPPRHRIVSRRPPATRTARPTLWRLHRGISPQSVCRTRHWHLLSRAFLTSVITGRDSLHPPPPHFYVDRA